MSEMVERQEKVKRFSMPEPNSGCWLWIGATDNRYGCTSLKGRLVKSHRFSYECFRGPIAAGLLVCHKCDVTLCVNPDHLFLGTQSDNLRDASIKGRNPMQVHPEKSTILAHRRNAAGEAHPRARLTRAMIEDAAKLSRSGASNKNIAARFGVSPSTIDRALSGVTYRQSQEALK